ncbi:MAG: tetratricopeptide repeat protein, partial [Acidobacteriota bacterium]
EYGYALLDAGRYPEALRQIERYAQLNPDEPNPYDSLAEIYLVMGQPEEAFEKYSKILEIDPQWPGIHYGRAIAAAMLGRFDEAFTELEAFRRTAAPPLAPSAYRFVTAGLLAKLGRYEEAGQLLAHDLDNLGGTAAAITETSDRLLQIEFALEEGRLDEAAKVAAAAVRSAESISDGFIRSHAKVAALSWAGIARARAGDRSAAGDFLARATAVSEAPGEVEGWCLGLLRGEIALTEGRLDEAGAVFQAAEPELKMPFSMTRYQPALLFNSCWLRDGRARVMIEQGDIKGAIAVYKRLLTPGVASKYTSVLEPRYILELARLLDRAGQSGEARTQYLRFVEL